MIYLVATPIGNLEDMTLRAIKVLSTCSYILCEDTRTSSHLLKHYEIKTPLKSFHKFNEKKSQENILLDLKNNIDIAIISDAGSPLICDPGFDLIKRCYEENIEIRALPGACSVIQALVLSGFDAIPFQFIGFLPKKESELKRALGKMFFYIGTSICFETPHRIIKTLKLIQELDPQRNIAIVRETTKKFEETLKGKAEELLLHFKNKEPRGEMVIVTEKGNPPTLSVEETLLLLQKDLGYPLNEAIKLCAKLKDIPKREIYNNYKIKDN